MDLHLTNGEAVVILQKAECWLGWEKIPEGY